MTDSKEHYKLHKSGKQWVAILVTTVGVGAGLAIQPQFVHAGTTATADSTSQNVQPSQSSSTEPAAETSKSATVKPTQVTSGPQSATSAQPTRIQPKTTLASDPQSGVTLSLNRTQVGYGQSLSPLTLTVHLTAKAGDVFKITVPKSTVTLRPVAVDQFQSAAVGTVAQTDNGDGTVTITDTIAQAGNYTQTLSYSPITNAQALQSNQAVAAPQGRSYTATAGLNGSAQTSAVSFTESVTPTAKISPVTHVAPDAAKTPKVQANTNYVYQFQVDQSNGVHDDTATQRVNSTFNVGGTTVTIPAPADFLLDSAQTRAIYGFGEADGTTITQPVGKGGDIVLTVPANSPVTNANQPYRLVGQYVLASGATLGDEIVTRPITFTQDEGTSTFTAQSNAATTWADTVVDATIAPNANTHGLTNYSLSAGGNSGKIPAQLVKDDDADNDPEYVATFGFSHLGAANDVAPTAIKLTIPDGLKVTGVQLPAAGTTLTQYLPGTTSYHYLLTFADGTTKEGDQAAGTILKTTTGGAVVRAVTLTPNFLAAGATSGPTGIGLIGKVAALYGDRVNYSVFIGDTMTTTINAVGGQTSSSFTQTVSAPLDEPQLYNSRQSSQPGAVADVEDVNTLSGLGGDVDEIWEPNFYWVVDKAFTVKVNAPGAMVWSRDTPDGTKTVVTISYSGKGYFKSNGMGNLVTISNAPDAVNGTYHIQTYVFSARTKFPSTATNYPVVSPEFAAQTGMNDTAVNFGYREWPISSIAGTYATYLAQGDDPTPQPTGSIDKNSQQPLTFYTNVINTTDEMKDTAVLLNLPQTGDGQGSQYPFKLKGPISLPAQLQSTTTGGATTPLQNAQVLYSTNRTAVDPTSTTLPTTGFVSANQVTNWGAIQSVLIKVGTMPANTTTGRIALIGTVDQQNLLGNRTAYLQAALYTAGNRPNVTDRAAAIKITGTSTIKAELYNGMAGELMVVTPLPDLTQTLQDNQDRFPDFPNVPAGDIPVGYQLDGDGNPKIYSRQEQMIYPIPVGQLVTNELDGSLISYQLKLIGSIVFMRMLDVDTGHELGRGPQVGMPGDPVPSTGFLIPSGYRPVKITGDTIFPAFGQRGNYTLYIAKVIPGGFKLKTANVAVEYTDADTGKIIRGLIKTGEPGTGVPVAASELPTGYQVVNQTGDKIFPTAGAAGKLIIQISKPKLSSVSVNYTDIDTGKVLSSETKTGAPTSQVPLVDSDVPTGYKVIKKTGDSIFPAGAATGQLVVYVGKVNPAGFKQITSIVAVEYTDTATGKVVRGLIKTGKPGATVSLAATDVPTGYKVIKQTGDATFPATGAAGKLTVAIGKVNPTGFKPKTAIVAVEYTDTATGKVVRGLIKTGKPGATVPLVTTDLPTGYRVIRQTGDATFPAAGAVGKLTVAIGKVNPAGFKRSTVNVEVEYVDAESGVLLKGLIKVGKPGEPVPLNIADIPATYKQVGMSGQPIFTNTDSKLIIYLKQEHGTLTIHFVDQNGHELKPAATQTGIVGEPFTVVPSAHIGTTTYLGWGMGTWPLVTTRAESTIVGTWTTSGQVLTLVYAAQPAHDVPDHPTKLPTTGKLTPTASTASPSPTNQPLPSRQRQEKATTATDTLPQTDEDRSAIGLSVVGALMSLFGVVGLVDDKRRKAK